MGRRDEAQKRLCQTPLHLSFFCHSHDPIQVHQIRKSAFSATSMCITVSCTLYFNLISCTWVTGVWADRGACCLCEQQVVLTWSRYYQRPHLQPGHWTVSCGSPSVLFTVPFTVKQVHKALKTLDHRKPPGPDLIEPYFLQIAADFVAQPLTIVFNLSIENKEIPSIWK